MEADKEAKENQVGKMTIEVETDKLSKKGWASLRGLLDECQGARTEADPCQAAVDSRSVLVAAASKLVGILRAEHQGNQLRIIQAYIAKGDTRLTAAELVAAAQKEGAALAGVLSSLTRNWRKAGMPGRKGIGFEMSYNPLPVGHYVLASNDLSVWQALENALMVKP